MRRLLRPEKHNFPLLFSQKKARSYRKLDQNIKKTSAARSFRRAHRAEIAHYGVHLELLHEGEETFSSIQTEMSGLTLISEIVVFIS